MSNNDFSRRKKLRRGAPHGARPEPSSVLSRDVLTCIQIGIEAGIFHAGTAKAIIRMVERERPKIRQGNQIEEGGA